jgi:hypothetical protein
MPVPPRHARTPRLDRLDPVQLVDYTRLAAAEVAAGNYPYVRYDEAGRWHQRIYRDGRVDLWLISWLPSQGTQLHDHGRSAGAFTVVAGELSEAIAGGRPAAIREFPRSSGDSVGFGPVYVHDVRNLSDAAAVSVHAYSPPLRSMTFYDLDEGRLTPLVSMATDDPESVPHVPGEAAA